MPTADDAFGRQMVDHLRGIRLPTVLERDDGYLDVATQGLAEYFADYAEWPAWEKDAISLAQGRVLDVGCGAGRHALHLQARGHAVVAIDSSRLVLDVARARGVRTTRRLALENINRFRDASFDTVLLLGHNFGLVGSQDGAGRLLREMGRITTPGGLVIGSTIDMTCPVMRENRRYCEANVRAGVMPGRVRVRLRYRAYRSAWFQLLNVSPGELRRLVQPTGWHVGQLFREPGQRSYAFVLTR